MQAELLYRKSTPMSTHQDLAMSQAAIAAASARSIKRETRDSRETIHSGHFMVSDFEAEAQDDEDELAVPVPEEEAARLAIIAPVGFSLGKFVSSSMTDKSSQQLSIETSLNKLFQCMSLAYRQKLTSPKWNRFKGIRLRWKDKIRLNNVIWRCWHMQFILKQNTLVCQFASPLDVDTHNKPEAVVLEGKYWKRKLAAVTAEYKKWRMFYRNKILGWTNKDGMDMLESMDTGDWGMGMGNSGMFGMGIGSSYSGASGSQSGDGVHSMLVDEDYMELMTDTLFSTISSNQPLYFPDPREIARGASLADFIQPSLGPLQPNLDDFIDTLEPLQEFLSARLPPVPEEDVFHGGALNSNYPELDLMAPINQVSGINDTAAAAAAATSSSTAQQSMQTDDAASIALQNLQYTARMYTQAQQQQQQLQQQQQDAAASVFRNNVSVTENFNTLQQSYAQQMQQAQQPSTQHTIREKQPRQSRISMRNSRLAQQQQQQQQQTYQAAQQQQQQQQHISYQTQQRTAYPMEIQSSALVPTTSTQMQLGLAEQTSQHVQNLINQQSFAMTSEQQQQVQKQAKSSLQCKPYNKIATQGYKFSPPAPTFDAQQCKFTSNNLKAMQQQQQSAQPVVAVTAQQPVQPHVLLQCKPTGIDLTAPALHPTKLLPRPAQTTATIAAPVTQPVEVKEEVFAVPKYQMKVRNRSRSSSSLNAPRMHPPPLVSAVSDPALNINNNVLLAHLLTNNSSNLYTVNTGSDKVAAQAVVGVKHILPMLPSTLSSNAQITNTTHHITSPITVQSMHNTTNVQNQVQQQSLQQSGPGQQMLLSTSSQAHQSQNSNPNSPKDGTSAHSPQGLSPSPMHSPMSIGSPLSPSRGYIKGDPERGQYKEQRRVGHIHAEQKRRYNIKNGFDMLYSLIPQLSQNPNTKMSKAAMLQKGAEYIRLLRSERHQLKDEMDKLRSQIDSLNSAISNCQAMLPATGAPVSRQRTNKMKEMFDEYVRTRTRDNWKFWIFSILLEPLMVSFNTSVSTASIEDLYRTTILWVEQHCSLVDLRPAVLNSLRYLCTATDILNDPSRLPEEALAAVNQSERRKSMQ